jgi:hypothetical protein
MPDRLTLSRRKGWRLPEGALSVARPTIWGNPFTVANARDVGFAGDDAALAAMCVASFRTWLGGSDEDWMGEESDRRRALILSRLPELRGRDLACWCKPGCPCHADVLMVLANA